MQSFSTGLSTFGKGLAVLVTALALSAFSAHAEKGDLVTLSAKKQHQDPTLVLTLGKADVVEVDGPVADVMVANPSIVDVSALQSNKLYLVGAAIGDTNIIALDAEGNVLKRMNVHVRIDEITLQNNIEALFPDENVKAKTVNDQVVLTGNVSTPAAANKIQDLAARVAGDAARVANLMHVRGDQQVMLRVKVMEMSRSALREFSSELSLEDSGNGWDNVIGSFLTGSGVGLTADPTISGTAVFEDGVFGPLTSTLTAMEDKGLVNVLAEPNLTAISGEEAGFLAGGEFPVPSGRDSEGNIQIAFRSFGVSLSFRPVVLSEDRISLQLQTEVSSLDRENAIPLDGGLEIPGLDVRRASTTVEMGSGGSLMIAGILQSQSVKGMAGLPGIMETPIIGDLIKSKSFSRQESELVVIVTPFLIQPFADPDQANKLPEPEEQPLAQAFAENIRRTYASRRLPAELFAQEQRFGYLIQ